MAERRTGRGREAGADAGARRARLRMVAALLLPMLAAACAAWIGGGVPPAARLVEMVSPSAAAQSVPPPSQPSKEYVYAGGRLVATEEPSPSNNAAFASQTVPTTMVAGRSYQVSVVMTNTGTRTWTGARATSLAHRTRRITPCGPAVAASA